VEWGDADHAVGPRFFNLEPDGFAVLGGINLTVEYVDPAIRSLIPNLEGDLSESGDDDCRRIFHVARQVLETGVAALVKGVPATDGSTVDLMLKRIDADQGRRVLALARVIQAGPPTPAEAGEAEPPPRFERIGPAPATEAAPPAAEAEAAVSEETAEVGEGGPPRAVPSTAGPHAPSDGAHAGAAPVETMLAAEPIARPAPVEATTASPMDEGIEQIGIDLQTSHDPEHGLVQALRDAALALGASTAAITLRRARTSVVEITYGMPSENVGLRVHDDEVFLGGMRYGAGEVISVEDVAADERIPSERWMEFEVLAALAAPLFAANENIGMAYFNWRAPQQFSAEQRAFVKSVACLFAPHAQVLRLMRVADREATYIATLLDVARAITSGGLRSSIAAAVLEVLHDRLGLDYGDIRLGEDHYRLTTLATLHGHEALPTNGAPYELARQAVHEHRMVTGRTVETPEGRDLEGIRHISVPFEVGTTLVGVMDLSFLGSRRFTPDEMELFSAVGRLLSLAFGQCPEVPAEQEQAHAPEQEHAHAPEQPQASDQRQVPEADSEA
jgi:GAF domain-containing protein